MRPACCKTITAEMESKRMLCMVDVVNIVVRTYFSGNAKTMDKVAGMRPLFVRVWRRQWG